jgi:membrane-bound lytic murein transglycosylase F
MGRGGWRWTLKVAGALGFAGVLAVPSDAAGQSGRNADTDRYNDIFRKYSKRYFGPAYDWRVFKAQGMAESNLDPNAKSWVGAQGVMQLMPSTFGQIRSQQPEFKSIDNRDINIAAGILYDRTLWTRWAADSIDVSRDQFMFGSYNAGRRTILSAQNVARNESLDFRDWGQIALVAPRVPRWRHVETIGYVTRIQANLAALDAEGRIKADASRRAPRRR